MDVRFAFAPAAAGGARTIAESFPRDAGLDADLQRELLANRYRYRAPSPATLAEIGPTRAEERPESE